MPLYEYECPHAEVEVLQRLSDPAPVCNRCNRPMRRKISRSAFILKGGGWASDNYGCRKRPSKEAE